MSYYRLCCVHLLIGVLLIIFLVLLEKILNVIAVTGGIALLCLCIKLHTRGPGFDHKLCTQTKSMIQT